MNIDPPSTPPVNSVDMSDAEAIKQKTEEQATMRLNLVKLLIAWHRQLVPLDLYCEHLGAYKGTYEKHANLKRYHQAPGVLEALEKSWKQSYADWKKTLKDKDLAASVKNMPKEVGIDALLKYGQSMQRVYWTLFRQIFNGFFCGPAQMVAVYFPDAQVRREFNAALDYAEAKGMIRVPASLGSFQSA